MRGRSGVSGPAANCANHLYMIALLWPENKRSLLYSAAYLDADGASERDDCH
jgi:hypothetical protein